MTPTQLTTIKWLVIGVCVLLSIYTIRSIYKIIQKKKRNQPQPIDMFDLSNIKYSTDIIETVSQNLVRVFGSHVTQFNSKYDIQMTIKCGSQIANIICLPDIVSGLKHDVEVFKTTNYVILDQIMINEPAGFLRKILNMFRDISIEYIPDYDILRIPINSKDGELIYTGIDEVIRVLSFYVDNAPSISKESDDDNVNSND